MGQPEKSPASEKKNKQYSALPQGRFAVSQKERGNPVA